MATRLGAIDEGEAAPIALDMSGLAAPWDDLTGGVLTMSAERLSPGSRTTMALVTGELDPAGADGKIHGGKVMVPPSWTPGTYLVTLEVDVPGAADHDEAWPQKQSFEIEIARVAAKPAP